jgi:hypothetical protein
MRNVESERNTTREGCKPDASPPAPMPTAQFRRRAWVEFQRAIDPLAPPKPLKQHPQQH